jgi:alpha-tubulin suppressor-like RCC1 family protein
MGYNATLTLAALNSSGLYTTNIKIDAAPPVAPTNLGWVNQTIYNLNATASWTVSSSADLAAQSIQLYQNAGCSIAFGGPVGLASASQSTYAFSASSFGSTYSYQITSSDAVGNSTISSCSSALNVAKSVTGTIGSAVTQDGTSCALVNGGVQCWGNNQFGTLGNNTTINSNIPVQVTGLTSGVQAIAVGYYHACAIVDGAAKCWGRNNYGQLGDGTTTNRNMAVAVSGLSSGVQAIAAGEFFTCALQNGSVKCWGYNQNGQLGNGSNTNSSVPVSVSSPLSSKVQDVKAFGSNVCALSDGKVFCWGHNLYGQLGNNTTVDSNIPVQVKNIAGTGSLISVQAISTGGFHSCALVGGGLQCWGRNTYYQLGDGTNVNKSLPVVATGLTSGVQAVSSGHLHTCVIVDGVSKCWGYNASGQVGDNTLATKISSTNVLNASLSSFAGTLAISSGVNQTCANVNGAIKCWGDNTNGTLGNSSNTNSSVAVQTTGLTVGTQAFAPGAFHSCAVINGGVQCWGRNDYGQLGNGTTTNSSTPVVAIAANSGAHAVAVGEFHTCAIANGGVKCWGLNDKLQITSDATAYYSTPQSYAGTSGPVVFSSGVQTITAGERSTCAVKDGQIYCWGDNAYGLLLGGLCGSESNSPFSRGVAILLFAGSSGSICATGSNGRLTCFGTNNAEPMTCNTSTPGDYGSSSPGIQSLAVSNSHICTVTNGAAECWGQNTTGALGDGTLTDMLGRDLEARGASVSGLSSGVQSISVSSNGSCAIVNGAVKCWGSYFSSAPMSTTINSGAQLIKGNGSPNGFNNTCAMVNGGVQCWGRNTYGQIGNGTTVDSLATPVQVSPWQ